MERVVAVGLPNNQVRAARVCGVLQGGTLQHPKAEHPPAFPWQQTRLPPARPGHSVTLSFCRSVTARLQVRVDLKLKAVPEVLNDLSEAFNRWVGSLSLPLSPARCACCPWRPCTSHMDSSLGSRARHGLQQ